MRFSLLALVRLILFCMVGVTLFAVVLGRNFRSSYEHRRISPVSCAYILKTYTPDQIKVPLLDLKTGKVQALPLPSDHSLTHVAQAPWVDEEGRSQVAGLWVRRTGTGADRINVEFGLARYRIPDGQILNCVTTDRLPTGRPCWIPGLEARILYAAADGALYSFRFENSRDAGASLDGCDHQPHRLQWSVPGYKQSRVYVMDICSSLDGRLVATVQTGNPHRRSFDKPQIWWLKANRDFTEIVDGGPLRGYDQEQEFGESDRFPTLGRDAQGRLCVAYLRRRPGVNLDWRLHVQPLVLDPASAAMKVDPSQRPGFEPVLRPVASGDLPRWPLGGMRGRSGIGSRASLPAAALQAAV